MTPRELYEKGIALVNQDKTLGALSCFEKAYQFDNSPLLLSYLGFCVAVERGQINIGLSLCQEAIDKDPDNPLHYLNMARVFLKSNQKDCALSLLRTGLSKGDHAEIRSLLEEIGLRKKAIFPFLQRKHFLNKYAGLILRKMNFR